MSLDKWENNFENRPVSTIFKVGIIVVAFFAVMGSAMWMTSFVTGWFSETGAVIKQEFGPRALLTKYEEFKDMAAALDAKRANIEVLRSQVRVLKEEYEGVPRNRWARVDQQSFSQAVAEVAGLISSFNDLASQYNANMAKFNFRFTNVGDLPQGAVEPLPREFKPYIVEEVI